MEHGRESGLTGLVHVLVGHDVDLWDAIGDRVRDEPREAAIGLELVESARAVLEHLAEIPEGLDDRETMAHLGDRVFARMVRRFRDAARVAQGSPVRERDACPACDHAIDDHAHAGCGKCECIAAAAGLRMGKLVR